MDIEIYINELISEHLATVSNLTLIVSNKKKFSDTMSNKLILKLIIS